GGGAAVDAGSASATALADTTEAARNARPSAPPPAFPIGSRRCPPARPWTRVASSGKSSARSCSTRSRSRSTGRATRRRLSSAGPRVSPHAASCRDTAAWRSVRSARWAAPRRPDLERRRLELDLLGLERAAVHLDRDAAGVAGREHGHERRVEERLVVTPERRLHEPGVEERRERVLELQADGRAALGHEGLGRDPLPRRAVARLEVPARRDVRLPAPRLGDHLLADEEPE